MQVRINAISGASCLPLLYLHHSSGIICIFVAITKAHAFNNNAFSAL